MSERLMSAMLKLDLDKDYSCIIRKIHTDLLFFKWDYGSMFIVDEHSNCNLKFIKFNEIATRFHDQIYRFHYKKDDDNNNEHDINIDKNKLSILDDFDEYTSLERILILGRDITDDVILGKYIDRKESLISDLEYIIGYPNV